MKKAIIKNILISFGAIALLGTAIAVPTALFLQSQNIPVDQWKAWWELNEKHDTLLNDVDDEVDFVLRGNFNINKEVLGISPIDGLIPNWENIKACTGLTNENEVIINNKESSDNNWHCYLKLTSLPAETFDIDLSFYYSAFNDIDGNITGVIPTQEIKFVDKKPYVATEDYGVENYYVEYKINDEDRKNWKTEKNIIDGFKAVNNEASGIVGSAKELWASFMVRNDTNHKNWANFVAVMAALEGLHCAQWLYEQNYINYSIKVEFNYIKKAATWKDFGYIGERLLDVDLVFEIMDETNSIISNKVGYFNSDNKYEMSNTRQFYSGWFKSLGTGIKMDGNKYHIPWDNNLILNFASGTYSSQRWSDSGKIESMDGFFFFLTTPTYKWDQLAKDIYPNITIN